MPDHHGAPYSLTEDFATVYRMHPLIPDDYVLRDHRDRAAAGRRRASSTSRAPSADDELRETGLANALYSFGIAHPGAITLHNFPRSLQALRARRARSSTSRWSTSSARAGAACRATTTSAPACTSRGITRWEDLTAEPGDRRAAEGRLPATSTRSTRWSGCSPRTRRTGFGFSDTAFRIFILMAVRRLQSDRFLTVDFRPEVYSPFGMDWVANNGMTSVILRHCPELAAVLPRDASAFAPWRTVVGGPEHGGDA